MNEQRLENQEKVKFYVKANFTHFNPFTEQDQMASCPEMLRNIIAIKDQHIWK